MKYDIELMVKSAEGTQTFRVEAKSKKDAITQLKAGNSVIVESDVEVYSLSDPELCDVREAN